MAGHGKAGVARQGPARRGTAWQGRRGSARLGAAGHGKAWLGRRGEAWSGQARHGKARQAGHGAAGEAWQGLAGRGEARRGKAGGARHGSARPGGAWQGRRGSARLARQGLARHGWARRGMARQGRQTYHITKGTSMRGRPKHIAIDKIRLDGDTQVRAAINEATVDQYAHAIEVGDQLPPVVVFHDGSDYWLADGFHRWHAHRKLDHDVIACQVISGSCADASWHAIGANRANGLQLSNADKRKAIGMALKLRPKATSREIARMVGCSHNTVESQRLEMGSVGQIDQLNRRVGADGKSYPAHRDPPPDVPSDDPPPTIPSDDTPPDVTGDETTRPTAPAPPQNATRANVAKPGANEPPAGPDASILDGAGQPVTDDRLAEVFRRREELAAIGREISAVKRWVLAAIDGGDPLYAGIHRQTVETDLDNARREIERSAPHAICAYCGGSGESCSACKGRGWLDIEAHRAAGGDK